MCLIWSCLWYPSNPCIDPPSILSFCAILVVNWAYVKGCIMFRTFVFGAVSHLSSNVTYNLTFWTAFMVMNCATHFDITNSVYQTSNLKYKNGGHTSPPYQHIIVTHNFTVRLVETKQSIYITVYFKLEVWYNDIITSKKLPIAWMLIYIICNNTCDVRWWQSHQGCKATWPRLSLVLCELAVTARWSARSCNLMPQWAGIQIISTILSCLSLNIDWWS